MTPDFCEGKPLALDFYSEEQLMTFVSQLYVEFSAQICSQGNHIIIHHYMWLQLDRAVTHQSSVHQPDHCEKSSGCHQPDQIDILVQWLSSARPDRYISPMAAISQTR